MLDDLQNDFQSFLLHGGDGMRRRVTGTQKVNVDTRLAIYYDAYRLRLLEALSANFPILHAWVGDEEFEAAGLAYVSAHPSQHFSIRYFGHRLPEFLASTDPWRERPYLAEMATLEWGFTEIFDANNTTIMKVEDMASIAAEAWPTMRLEIHPAVRRLDLRWNVPIIWKAVNQNIAIEKDPNSCRGETSATPASEKVSHQDSPFVDMPAPKEGEYPQPWVLWRQDLRNFFRSMTVDEAWALDAARRGENFAAICEGLCEWIDAQNVGLHAAGYLKQWITQEMVSGIATHPT